MSTFPMRSSRPAAGSRDAANQATAAMIELIDDLISVIAAENRQLAEGMPASAAELTKRKALLADALSQWVGEVRSQRIVVADADPRLHSRLRELCDELGTRMHENLDRLRRALAATGRRVDAIMQAIREQVAPRPTSYGANGRVASPVGGAARTTGRYF